MEIWSKKKLLVLGLLGALILLILFMFVTRRSSGLKGEPLQAIPKDAAIIFRINNYHHLLQDLLVENKVWQNLSEIEAFNPVHAQMAYLDSLLIANSDAQRILHDNPSYISAHYTGNGKIGLIFYFNLSKNTNEKKIQHFFQQLLGSNGTIVERIYQGNTIYDASLPDQDAPLHFSFAANRGLMLFSFSSILLEDAVRQFDLESSITDSDEFAQLLGTAGKNVDANVFINYTYFPKALSILARESLKDNVRNFTHFASWGELDVNISDNQILLNGFTSMEDSANYLGSVFLNQHPQSLKATSILPSYISTFIAIGLSDFSSYISDYQNYLKKNGDLNAYQNAIAALNKACNSDLLEFFTDVVDDELVLAMADNKVSKEDNTFILLKTKSESLTERKLTDILAKIARINKVSVNTYKHKYTLDNEYSFLIYQLPLDRPFGKILGGIFNEPKINYLSFYDNYLIAGNSKNAIANFIHSNVLHKTLNTNYTFKEFSQAFASKANISFYTNLTRSRVNYEEFLHADLLKSWEENIFTFQQVQGFGFQITSSGKMLYTNLALKYISDYVNKPRTVWESLLDTAMGMKPVFVENHYTKEKEIFLQDLQNNTYLINKAGRILWKVRLPEKILSDIVQIDLYNNSKLQMLFSTKNYIYLLDRNGNTVEGFPVQLRSPATNGVSVFDYDNNKNYRYAIACENKKVYMYGKSGNIIPGWKFSKTEETVSLPLQHFRIADKDYIVFGDKFKTYILNRRGQDRVVVKEIFEKSVQNAYVLETIKESNITRLTTTNAAGKVQYIYFDGHLETVDLGTFSEQHFFDYKDMDGDGAKDFIFLDGNALKVFKNNKKELFEKEFNNRITERTIYFYFSYNDRKLGIIDSKAHKIYLINNNGKTYNGFPLRGNTAFSIGYFNPNASQFNLIVGSEDNFLYNYAVN